MSEIVTTYATMISPASAGRLQATLVARTEEQVSALSGAWAVSRAGSREVQPAVPGQEELGRKEDKEPKRDSRQKDRESHWRRMDGILFAYNFRGDLRIKYMDSVNKLVYQTPPVLLAKLSDLMAVTTPVDVTV